MQKSINTNMNTQEIENKINKLRQELHRHNYLYYVKAQSEISDYEYDMLLKELEKLEQAYPQFQSPNSPTRRVGSDVNTTFKQAKHQYPMLSLGNTYNIDELTDFDNRIKKLLPEDTAIDYACELKYDGVAISLIYENGTLVQAVTRGDGTQGDIVTDNIKTIKSIPLDLNAITKKCPKKFEIRGEIIMPRPVFDQLNEQRIKENQPPLANPRNAAAGTIKMQNSALVAKRKLDAIFYYLIADELPSKYHDENMKLAGEMGFKVSGNTKIASNINEVFEYINYWDIHRKNLNYDTDGVVIKVNNTLLYKQLGATGKSPRWAISYKFKAEQAQAKLLNIEFQVGRTGIITPVAHLSPAELAGTVVKRASLHNQDIIQDLDLHYGDTVLVEKGGEIIPKITGVIKEKRPENAPKVQFASHCPECNHELTRPEGEAAHYCTNEANCPAQIKGKIEHFVSRKAMNINCGEATVNALYEKGLLANIANLYRLTLDDIMSLEGFKAKSSKNLYTSIQASKEVPFERVLYAIGIRHIGQNTAKLLAKEFGNLQNLREATFEELTAIDEVGEKIAESIITFFKTPSNMDIISKLQEVGLQFEIKGNEPMGNKLAGLKIVLSGTFERHSRDELKKLIELNGGKNSSSISKNTDYFLTGNKVGAKKLEKANQLNIKIISESDFEELIG